MFLGLDCAKLTSVKAIHKKTCLSYISVDPHAVFVRATKAYFIFCHHNVCVYVNI